MNYEQEISKSEEYVLCGSINSINDEIIALKEMFTIKKIISDNENESGIIVEGIEVVPISFLGDTSIEEIVIVDYYWKEKAKILFEKYGIRKAKVFKWDNREEEQYSLKDISCVPLFYGFEPEEKKEETPKTSKSEKESNKHVLFLSYYFPPIGGPAIQRTLKYVKYLTRMGYQITVITVDDTNKEIKDLSLICEIPKGVRIVRFPNNFDENETLTLDYQKKIYSLLSQIDSSKKFLSELYNSQKEQLFYPLPDKLIVWATEVMENIAKYVDMSTIDILYSTVPYWSPHLLGYLLKKRYGIPWVADYRDVWTVSKEYAEMIYPFIGECEFAWHRFVEQRVLPEMDALVTIGENTVELFKQDNRYEIADSKIHNIPNGYDEEDFGSIRTRSKKNDKFTICYNGSLGLSRKPECVLKVISDLIQERLIDRDRICWIFNGSNSSKKFYDYVKKFDAYGITENRGMLSHLESIQSASDADVLVVYGEFGVVGRYVYTGKFMEYLRIGRPILAFSSSDSPISSILAKTRLGENFDLYDEKGIRNFILKHYCDWMNSENKKPTYNPSIEVYSREKQAEQMAAIFEMICDSHD